MSIAKVFVQSIAMNLLIKKPDHCIRCGKIVLRDMRYCAKCQRWHAKAVSVIREALKR